MKADAAEPATPETEANAGVEAEAATEAEAEAPRTPQTIPLIVLNTHDDDAAPVGVCNVDGEC